MNSATDRFARGKLLLAGEYLVLTGAAALAMPVRFGQQMSLQETAGRELVWKSTDPAGTWFRGVFTLPSFEWAGPQVTPEAHRLQELLLAARRLNPRFPEGDHGLHVAIHADYPVGWGLGSSSTLIYLVARWAGIPPFDLFRQVSHGSGYDVACADQTDLISYRLEGVSPRISGTTAGKALRESAWFCWLGRKQDSAREAGDFLAAQSWTTGDVERISELSHLICTAGTPDELMRWTGEHERIIGGLLQREPVGALFPSFPGKVKSLGAWGGDFAMFVSREEPGEVRRQLERLGLPAIFSYPEIAAAG